jgi:hypothetical protein
VDNELLAMEVNANTARCGARVYDPYDNTQADYIYSNFYDLIYKLLFFGGLGVSLCAVIIDFHKDPFNWALASAVNQTAGLPALPSRHERLEF